MHAVVFVGKYCLQLILNGARKMGQGDTPRLVGGDKAGPAKGKYAIRTVCMWVCSVKFFQLLHVFVNFHNKLLEGVENERTSQTASCEKNIALMRFQGGWHKPRGHRFRKLGIEGREGRPSRHSALDSEPPT